MCKKCKIEIPDNSKFCNVCGTDQGAPAKNKKVRGNGCGSVYKLPSGKYKVEVVLYYYIKDGKLKKKRRTAVFDKKKDAMQAIPTLQNNSTADNPTLSTLYNMFCTTQKYINLSKSQRGKLQLAWNKITSLHLKKIGNLSFSDMQQTVDTVAPTHDTAKDTKALLGHLYDIAIKNDWVDQNKAKKLEIPPQPKPKKEVFTDGEVNAFWVDYHAGNDFTGYILLMIYVGLRYGELATIAKKNVFLNQQYMIGGIKTDTGQNRELAIADCVLPIVEHFYQAGKSKLLEMSEDTFYKKYWETLARLGVRPLPPQTGRHTYFTRLTARDVHTGIITEAGEHKNYQTTLKNYVKIPLAEKIKAVNKI